MTYPFAGPFAEIKDQIFRNCINFEGWVNFIARQETDISNCGLAFIQAAKEGQPVSEEERRWIWELVCESMRKKRYQIINETFDFLILARPTSPLVSAKLFSRIQ